MFTIKTLIVFVLFHLSVAPQCDEITPYFGGTVTYHGGRRRFTKAVLKCNHGFSMYPNENMIYTCKRLPDETYSWEPEPSFCYKKQELEVPDNCFTNTRTNELLHKDSYKLFAKNGYEFKQFNQYLEINTGITITNYNGTLDPSPPECKPARCSTTDTNMLVHYMDGRRAFGKVESGHDYKFMCPNYFEFRDDKYLNEIHVTGRCDSGKFKDVPTSCAEKRCRLNNNDIALRIGEQKFSVVEHNDQVHVECNSVQHELFNPSTNNYENPFDVRCNYGKFSKVVNELTCFPKRCDTSQFQNTEVLYLDNSEADRFVKSHVEYLFRCDISYEFRERSNSEFIRSHCKYGSFEKVPICTPKRCRLNNNAIALRIGLRKLSVVEHNDQVHVECNSVQHELFNPSTNKYENPFDVRCNYGNFSKVVNELTCLPNCVIEESKVYKYTDENGDEISTIRNGGSVKVDCLYPNSYYYDYDGYDDSHYIHCKNGALTPVSLTCDDTTESCSDLTLTNGQIKHDVQLDKYTIECNQGFHLNVRSEVPCTCDNQTLTCAGGKIPVCLEDDCTIPSQFDSRLTLTQNKDGNQEYIGGDNVIKAGDDVIFSCSKVTNMIYEPFNRSLKCREGKWIAIDKYGWPFVTNGTFPECREAPQCDEITPYFGGTVTYHGGRRRFTKAVLKCNHGFSMYPNENMIYTCKRLPDETYSWEPEPSFCYKKQELEVPDNCFTNTRTNELLHKDSYKLFAKNGYEFKQFNQYLEINTGITITNYNGTLDPSPPECKPARCPTINTDMLVHYMDGRRANGKVESGHDYKFMCPNDYEFRDDEYLNEAYVTGRCDLGKFKDIPTSCVEKRCRLNNNDIALRIGVQKISVVEHNNRVHVECNSVQHELFNPSTNKYENPFDVRCNYGKFSKVVNELTCSPKRCDTSQFQNTEVLYLDESEADRFVKSHVEYLFRCDIGYEFRERSNSEFIRSHCKYGSFEKVPICTPKRCRLNNNDIALRIDEQTFSVVEHNDQVHVECNSVQHELFNPRTNKYENPFDVRCNYGKFSKVVNELTCPPKRCATSQLQYTEVLYLDQSKADEFVQSDKEYLLRCDIGYEIVERLNSEFIRSHCKYGSFEMVPICTPKSCTVVYSADKIQLSDKDGLSVVTNGTIVPHNTKMSASCQQGYELSKDKNVPSSHTAECEFGVLKMPQCVEKSCFNKAKEGECYKRIGRSKCTKREFYVRHNKQIILECIKKYSMMPINPNNKTTSDDNAVFICDKGILNKSYQCSPDPCPIPLLFNASTNHTLDKIESGDKITFTCNEGHHIQDTVNDRSWTGQCKAATLKNVPNGCVPDNCVLSSVKNGRYIDVESEEMVYRTIGHGDKVQLQCLDGFNMVNSKNEIVTTEVPHIECDKGSIMTNTYYCKKCINGKNETKQAIGGVENNTTESEIRDDIMKCKEYDVDENDVPTTKPTTDSVESTTVNSNEKVINTTDAKDCVIEESKVYKYTDENGNEISKIRNGGSVNVDCLYPNIYSYDYDLYDDSHYIYCKNDTLTPVNLICDDTTAPCSDFTLKHGEKIAEAQLDKYKIKCDQGFHLNAHPDVICTCVNQTITCPSETIPVCLEDDCTIPSQFDRHLTLTQNKDGNQRYIGSDNVIKAGDDVIFSCSKDTNMIYEPFNRSFKCREGKWIAIDNNSWSFETNGTFPECKEAECDPPCENDGKCHVDNKCVCGESYTGNRCEQVKCPDACVENEGRCDNSGKCVCPVGSYGKNCEIKGCDLPAGTAPYKSNRQVFQVHESIYSDKMECPQQYEPSNPVMTCTEDGSWDNIITCLRSNFKYVISFQLSKRRYSSTKDYVYIEIVGTNGKRTDQIGIYTWGEGGLSEINYNGTDVTPIDHVVISKKTKVAGDDNMLIDHVSIFVPAYDDYYVFKDQHPGNKWLTSDTPRTFTISGHPERCVHTYTQALNRTPVRRPSTIWTSVRGCKQACVKEESFRCASVFFMPSSKNKGHCTLHRDSASSNHFRDNFQDETRRQYKSFNRICRKK